ncbi:MAG: hypothetical protein EHM35_01185 [Planctomycetaceae bacterium]|nr:MAG: hypothetical protein EHM35_01185 [Planctomycetaceae bacterium]
MAGKGGKRPGAGRKKGVPNSISNKSVREAVLTAFNAEGGVKYLRMIAKKYPWIFCSMLTKTMPTVLAGDEDNPLALRVLIDRPPEETREQWIERTQRERGIAAPITAMVVPPARSTNGRDHS